MKKVLRLLIPAPLLESYRGLRKSLRSKARARARAAAKQYSVAEFTDLIRQLGVADGDTLMVHSALGQFNNVEGGAEGVLAALRTAIGPSGNLVVPTFPFWLNAVSTAASFDARETPSNMGILTEIVRRMPEARRSLHPTHAIAVIGPDAQALTEGHEDSLYAFGETSPYFRMAAMGGKSLMIGVNLNSLTCFHVYEDLVGHVDWLPVYEDMARTFEMTAMDGRRFNYTGYFHSLDMANIRDVERQRAPLLAVDGIRTFDTGYAKVHLLDMAKMVVLGLTELSEGRSGYGPIDVPADERTRIAALAETVRRRLAERPTRSETVSLGCSPGDLQE